MAAGIHESTQSPSSDRPGLPGTAQDMKEAAKQQASATWNDAKQTARSKLSEQQQGAAAMLDDTAQALRKAGHEIGGERSDSAGRLTEWAANGLEQISSTLKSKDLDGMMRDMQSLARNQPVAFFSAAVAAGFLAARFFKSSSEPRREDRSIDDISSASITGI